MIQYAPLQQKWLKHHYTKWQREYGWSASEFAKRVRQPAEALAPVLDVPLEEFAPLPPVAAPDPPPPPPALPDPQSSTVVIEPGVSELLPRERKPDTPPAQTWDARRGFRVF